MRYALAADAWGICPVLFHIYFVALDARLKYLYACILPLPSFPYVPRYQTLQLTPSFRRLPTESDILLSQTTRCECFRCARPGGAVWRVLRDPGEVLRYVLLLSFLSVSACGCKAVPVRALTAAREQGLRVVPPDSGTGG
jgi:hypothetical protein